jgi:hypothetical protein
MRRPRPPRGCRAIKKKRTIARYRDTIIPHNSCQYKYAALRDLINLLNVYQVNPSARKDGLIIIQNILYNNGFPLQFINNLLRKQKLLQPPTKKENFDQKQKWGMSNIEVKEISYCQEVLSSCPCDGVDALVTR